ncbi:MAG: zinc-regulated TonB-dependent outer membrane receptor [Myxococcota bacterium]
MRTARVGPILLWIGLCTAPAVRAGEPGADGLSEEERAALEEALEADAAEREESTDAEPGGPLAAASGALQSMNPRISLILDTTLAWFDDDEPLQLGGHDPTETGFNLQQLELHMEASVDPYFRLDANLVYSQFGVEVEEAYATTLGLPANLQVRAGQFKTRFGRLNPTHPHSWSFVDQPLANGKLFGSEGSRGLGVEVSWLAPLPWYVEVLASSTMATGACCARSFFGGEDPGVDDPGDLLYTLGLRQFFALSDAWSLQWGLTSQLGPNSTGHDNRTEIYGTDLYLRWRPPGDVDRTSVSLTVEGMFRTRQVPGDVLQDGGGYAQLVWRIDPEWEVGGRYEWVGGVEDDPLDPEWDEPRQRASLQGTFYPSHFSRLRLQGSRDDPGWREDPIWAGFLALEVLIGAHGAHGY